MKNIASIIVILLIGFGIYYFANEYAVTRQMNEQMMEESALENSAIQGKINIDEVCQGALMYMTFTDGAAAEKFVAECKEGKHPEVIERFKADLNLGAGAEI